MRRPSGGLRRVRPTLPGVDGQGQPPLEGVPRQSSPRAGGHRARKLPSDEKAMEAKAMEAMKR
eukprot:11111442-Heterocapsa_arctica.AAC.1